MESAALGFYIQSVYEDAEAGRYILIDDISMVKTKDGEVLHKPEPPAKVRATPQQREMELSWNAVADADASYQVYINGNLVATTKSTKFVATALEPGRAYTFNVKTIKGDVASDASTTVSQTTMPLNFGVDEEDRHTLSLLGARTTATTPPNPTPLLPRFGQSQCHYTLLG